MTKGLPSNRQLYGIIRARPGGGRVLRLTTQNAPDVSGAHTYVSNGILSHNIKMNQPEQPSQV